jgi:hypothetical protein
MFVLVDECLFNWHPRDQALDRLTVMTMSKAIPKECLALLTEASELFEQTGCVPDADGGASASANDSARREGIHFRDN